MIDLEGKPLIAYTIDVAKKVEAFSEIVLSTDDEAIANIGLQHQIKVPFIRPTHLASDEAASIDVVVHALEFMQRHVKPFYAVCLLQPTVPLRHSLDVSQAIDAFIQSDADSLISVRPIPHVYNPHWAFRRMSDSDEMTLLMDDENIIARRQDLPEMFHRDGSIYLTKSSVVMNQRSFYGNRVIGFTMQHSPDINIDTQQDLDKARNFLARHPDFY